jgi:hypothetical protein
MRTLRFLVAGAATLAALPSAGHAQDGRLFENSWFWGAKAGIMSFGTTRVSHAPAPMIGGEWLITRKQGALYLSFDQAFFSQTSTFTVFDADTTGTYALTQPGVANIDNMRRFTVAAMGFPAQFGMLRPYFGVGFALNFISSAVQTSGPRTDLSESSLKDVQSRGAPIFIGGLQAQYARFSVFGQGSMMPAKRRFLLNNQQTYFLEGGIRYNVGSSIERQR